MATTIFYKNRTPLHVQVHTGDVEFVAGDELKTYTVHPGPNKIDEEVWAHLQKQAPVATRLDHGKIVESEPTKALLSSLRGPANRDAIGLLCCKSRDVPDADNFAAEEATSRDGAVREIEDQLEEMKRQMPTVGG